MTLLKLMYHETLLSITTQVELLQCFHNIVSGQPISSVDENCKPTCFVHKTFCLNIVEYLKCECGFKQGDPFPYKEFIHYIPAEALR